MNLRTTADALPSFIAEKNLALFTKHKIFTTAELHSRYEILMEVYCKKLHIEAATMVDMVHRQILPAIARYSCDLTRTALEKRQLSSDIPCDFELGTVKELSEQASRLRSSVVELEDDLLTAEEFPGVTERAAHYRDVVLSDMAKVREAADGAEVVTAKAYWPFPDYTDLLYSVM